MNHNAGRAVERAHAVKVEPGSQLGSIMGADKKSREVPVNSSHHQSADVIGDGLRVVARSPLDGVVEALEGTVPGHFVLAVLWHPERSVKDSKEVAEAPRKISLSLIAASRANHAE